MITLKLWRVSYPKSTVECSNLTFQTFRVEPTELNHWIKCSERECIPGSGSQARAELGKRIILVLVLNPSRLSFIPFTSSPVTQNRIHTEILRQETLHVVYGTIIFPIVVMISTKHLQYSDRKCDMQQISGKGILTDWNNEWSVINPRHPFQEQNVISMSGVQILWVGNTFSRLCSVVLRWTSLN